MFTELTRTAYRELRLVRSIGDTRKLLEKAGYLVPRLLGHSFANSRFPQSLQLEPTNICNAQCISCSAGNSHRLKGFMSIELFREIINQAAEIGVKLIHLYLHGEPLLHPKIVEMIRYIKEKQLAVHVTSNGSPLDPQKTEALLNTGLTIADHFRFSVLGSSAEVHEQIMQGVNHDRVVSNILGMYEMRQRKRMSGPVIETIFYTMPENSHEQKSFHDYWLHKVDHARVVGGISKSFRNYHDSGNKQHLRKQTCSQIWERMTIYWNGDVTLCCSDVNGNYTLGNLQEKSIAELWTCPELLSIRKLHERKEFHRIPICAHCDMSAYA